MTKEMIFLPLTTLTKNIFFQLKNIGYILVIVTELGNTTLVYIETGRYELKKVTCPCP